MSRAAAAVTRLFALALLGAGAGLWAAAEGAPGLFCERSWADSSGFDGLGGVKVTAGKGHSGGKILPLREDDCGVAIDDEGADAHPSWVAFRDEQGRTSLSFEWTWVTQGEQKHWDKTWGGAGLAFNDAWSPLDARGARFLVLYARASQQDPGWDLRISLNASGTGKDVNSGGLSLRDYADGRTLGPAWNRVVIPLERFPNIAALNLGSLTTIGFDLAGFSPENTPCWVRFDDVYFTDTDLLTSVSRLGWVPQGGQVLLSWDLPEAAKPERFVVSVDGKPLRTVDGLLRQVLLPAAALRPEGSDVAVRAVRKSQVSPDLTVRVKVQAHGLGRAAVAVEGTARHRVGAEIFGANNLNAGMVGGLATTVNRWGGNRKSVYNWRDDVDATGFDWFFLNETWSDGKREEDKSWYKFVRDSLKNGVQVNLVVPMLDYVARRPPAGTRLCSFPLSLYPGQPSSDGQGCGNGVLADGSLIWGNDPNLAGVPNSPALQEAWVRAVVAGFGPAAKGGVRFYSLDNEPGLWSSTHRDFKPRGVGYDELVQRSVAYASAIKRADPGAQVMGLVAWGVKELAGSNLDFYGQGPDAYQRPDKFGPGDRRYFDRQRHGGMALVDWYLRAMRQAGEKAGRRLIDYLDVHWYPEVYGRDSQGKLQRLSNDLPYDPALAPLQFDALREFWDPSFDNPDSWTDNAENAPLMWKPYHPVIPSLRALLRADYPGTRLAITEYDTGSRSYYHGALLHAVALGIFMDQGLDAANFWYETDPSKFLYWAHRLYSNYDGKGGNVLGWSYRADSSNPDLYAFSSARAGKAFVVLVNRSVRDDIQADISLPWAARSVRLHLLSEPAGPSLVHLKAQAVGGRRATVSVPAFSAALAEFDLGTAQ